MPVSELPAGRTHCPSARRRRAQQQCRRQRPVGRRQGRPRLARACEPGARRAAHDARARRSAWPRPAMPTMWRKMVEAAIARTRRLSPRDASAGEARAADPRWTLVACILASSLSFVDGSVLSVALPAIRASYGAGAQEVQWVVNAYLLPLSALLLLGGALGDHFGRRRLLVIGTEHLRRRPRWSARWRRACRSCSPPAPRRASARRCCCPTAWRCSTPPSQGEKRGRAVGIWAAAGRGGGGGRAADRRLAGRHRRLAGDLLHQPAARARRDPARAALRRRKPRARRRPHRLCRRAAGDRRARRPDLCADLVVGDAALHATRR